MNLNCFDQEFWQSIDMLVAESEIVIDRPRGSRHPRYPDIIYPVNYGFLKGTVSMDGGGIDVWQGSDPEAKIDSIICTIDLKKKDCEIKILIGCTEEEKGQIYRLHNENKFMKGIMVKRTGTTMDMKQ